VTALAVNAPNDKRILLFGQELARRFNLRDWERMWI
jgi:hypothetical protein